MKFYVCPALSCTVIGACPVLAYSPYRFINFSYLLVRLHHVAEIRLRHLPAVDPEAGSVEGDLDQ